MENRRILNWREWPPALKGQTTGAVIGFSLTVFPALITMMLVPGDAFLVAAVFLAVSFPTGCVYRLFGWELPYASGHEPAWTFLLLVVVVNTILFAIFGRLIGFLFERLNRRSQKLQD